MNPCPEPDAKKSFTKSSMSRNPRIEAIHEGLLRSHVTAKAVKAALGGARNSCSTQRRVQATQAACRA